MYHFFELGRARFASQPRSPELVELEPPPSLPSTTLHQSDSARSPRSQSGCAQSRGSRPRRPMIDSVHQSLGQLSRPGDLVELTLHRHEPTDVPTADEAFWSEARFIFLMYSKPPPMPDSRSPSSFPVVGRFLNGAKPSREATESSVRCATRLRISKSGRRGGTRTPNPRIWSPVHYQLCYAPRPLDSIPTVPTRGTSPHGSRSRDPASPRSRSWPIGP